MRAVIARRPTGPWLQHGISVYLAFDLRSANADNPGLHRDQTDIAQQLQDEENAKG